MGSVIFGATTIEQLDLIIQGLDVKLNEEVMKEISVIAKADNIPESIVVDMEEIKSKEKVRLSSLQDNADYDFPSSLKTEDPVLVSVLTARGGAMLLEDELEEEVDAEAQEGDDAATDKEDGKAAEENNSEDSEKEAE